MKQKSVVLFLKTSSKWFPHTHIISFVGEYLPQHLEEVNNLKLVFIFLVPREQIIGD